MLRVVAEAMLALMASSPLRRARVKCPSPALNGREDGRNREARILDTVRQGNHRAGLRDREPLWRRSLPGLRILLARYWV
jgi:hypothetical protein